MHKKQHHHSDHGSIKLFLSADLSSIYHQLGKTALTTGRNKWKLRFNAPCRERSQDKRMTINILIDIFSVFWWSYKGAPPPFLGKCSVFHLFMSKLWGVQDG